MTDPSDDDDNDAYEPTQEEREAEALFMKEKKRFPTFYALHKIATRYARLSRLRELSAPSIILEKEQEMLERSLDGLCQILPFNAENQEYGMVDILQHVVQELSRLQQDDEKTHMWVNTVDSPADIRLEHAPQELLEALFREMKGAIPGTVVQFNVTNQLGQTTQIDATLEDVHTEINRRKWQT